MEAELNPFINPRLANLSEFDGFTLGIFLYIKRKNVLCVREGKYRGGSFAFGPFGVWKDFTELGIWGSMMLNCFIDLDY